MDVKEIITNLRVIKQFMKYFASNTVIKLLRMQSKGAVFAQNEDDHSSCSGFDSTDFITYLDQITKPLKPSELKLLNGIHMSKQEPLDLDDSQHQFM